MILSILFLCGIIGRHILGSGELSYNEVAFVGEHLALVSGGALVVLEPIGVCRDDGKRPDGMSLIPWSWGLPLHGDFTIQTPWPHLIYLLLQVMPAGW